MRPLRTGSHSKLEAYPNCEAFRMGAISNGNVFLSTTRRYIPITSASSFRMGFTNDGYKHGSRYDRVPSRAQDYWKVVAFFV